MSVGLRKCFEAADTLWYDPWPEHLPPPLIHWHEYLYSNGRHFSECLAVTNPDNGSSYGPGAIWAGAEGNEFDSTTIHYANQVLTVLAGSGGGGLDIWRLDGLYGRRLPGQYPELYNEDVTRTVGGVTTIVHHRGDVIQRDSDNPYQRIPYDSPDFFMQFSTGGVVHFAYEPSGYLWQWGAPSQIGASVVDQSKMLSTAALGHVTPSDFPAPPDFIDAVGNVADMNIDRGADRLFVRWSNTLSNRRTHIYRISTHTYLGDIWTPNQTAGIVLTHDGFVYLHDVGDWICVYDYAGTFYSAFKNPRRETYLGAKGGIAYGWDRFHKRLLMVGMVADNADGSPRVRVKGYYPEPLAAGLTPPLPLQVPRAGRTIHFLTHLYGEGGEPLSSRRVTANIAGPGITDRNGDVELATTPAQAGTEAVTITADASPSTIDPPESQTGDRGVIVELISPYDGQGARYYESVPLIAKVPNYASIASLGVTVTFEIWRMMESEPFTHLDIVGTLAGVDSDGAGVFRAQYAMPDPWGSLNRTCQVTAWAQAGTSWGLSETSAVSWSSDPGGAYTALYPRPDQFAVSTYSTGFPRTLYVQGGVGDLTIEWWAYNADAGGADWDDARADAVSGTIPVPPSSAGGHDPYLLLGTVTLSASDMETWTAYRDYDGWLTEGQTVQSGVVTLRQFRWLPAGTYNVRIVVRDTNAHVGSFSATNLGTQSISSIMMTGYEGLWLGMSAASSPDVPQFPVIEIVNGVPSPVPYAPGVFEHSLGTTFHITIDVSDAVGEVTIRLNFARQSIRASDPAIEVTTPRYDAAFWNDPANPAIQGSPVFGVDGFLDTVTLPGNGRYVYDFTPDKAGDWFVVAYANDSQDAWDADYSIAAPATWSRPNRNAVGYNLGYVG